MQEEGSKGIEKLNMKDSIICFRLFIEIYSSLYLSILLFFSSYFVSCKYSSKYYWLKMVIRA